MRFFLLAVQLFLGILPLVSQTFLHHQTYAPYWGLASIQTPLDDKQNIRFSFTYSNTFRHNNFNQYADFFLVDYESLLLSLDWTSGSSSIGSFQVQLDSGVAFPGILDGGIEGFHSLFNLPNQGREFQSQYQTRVEWDTGNDDFVASEDFSFYPNISLLYESPNWIGEWGSLSLLTSLKIPSLGPFPLESTWSGGLGLLWELNLESWYFYVSQGAVAHSPVSVGPFELTNPFTYQGLWGVWFQVNSIWDLGIEAYYQTSPFGAENHWVSGGAGHLLFGGNWHIDSKTTLQLSFWEEFFTWATMEVGVQMTAIYRP